MAVTNNKTLKAARESSQRRAQQAAKKQGGNYTGIPRISTGILDKQMELPALEQEAAMRERQLGQSLTDLGVNVTQGKDGARFSPVNAGDPGYNPYGAWQQGYRSARQSSADRGFGTTGLMRRSAFDPLKQDIRKEALRQSSDVQFQNRSDRRTWSNQMMRLWPAAVQYAIQNKAYGSILKDK